MKMSAPRIFGPVFILASALVFTLAFAPAAAPARAGSLLLRPEATVAIVCELAPNDPQSIMDLALAGGARSAEARQVVQALQRICLDPDLKAAFGIGVSLAHGACRESIRQAR